MLHKSFLAKEKDIERKLLALPHFEKDTIQQEPPEIVALFKDYAETTSEEKIQRWKMIKQQQKNYLASWKLFDKSDKSKEQEHLKRTRKAKPGSSMDHRKRVPTPPPPPPRPDLGWPGTRAKAAPKRAPLQLKERSAADSEDFWLDRLADDRRIGQASLPREGARRDRSGVSQSAAPLLASNATASIPFCIEALQQYALVSDRAKHD